MLKKIGKALIIFLAILGVLFIVLLLWPEDEEPGQEDLAMQDISQEEMVENSSENINSEENGASAKEQTQDATVVYTDAEPVTVGTDAKSATIMIYMNGSDLESQNGEATEDISEMLESGIGDNVNVIIQTMGTRLWHDYGISSDTAQTWKIQDGELVNVRDDLGQLDCTSADTLSEFINYSKTTYPADRYMFLFWDHGGGPVYGFGYDEWQSEEESLTIAEMSRAFSENSDIHFDIIGMDCCIMANVETCYALSPYCKYTILSEDFESGIGWYYTEWMGEFEENPGISSPVLGKNIVDDIIAENESNWQGDSSCMTLFNEAASESLFETWKTYAYLNEETLMNKNYSKSHKAKGRGGMDYWDMWDADQSDVTLSDYYISDMMAIIESVDTESEEAKNLISALKACVAYTSHTSDKNELTGVAVSLPYGDEYFYNELVVVYSDLGMDEQYIDWLGGFVTTSGFNEFYNYNEFENGWNGWGTYENEYGCSDGSCTNSWFYEGDGSYSEDFYSAENSDYYDYNDHESYDDWIYDYEDELWYLYEDGFIYMYDDTKEEMYCYDEYEDAFYYYDYNDDEWYIWE
ncbi:MAG: hypothetical protein K6A23_08800 [Butyrivibrio sp.]|nr:hypothetical protein [Butyrivibrio sp.]